MNKKITTIALLSGSSIAAIHAINKVHTSLCTVKIFSVIQKIIFMTGVLVKSDIRKREKVLHFFLFTI